MLRQVCEKGSKLYQVTYFSLKLQSVTKKKDFHSPTQCLEVLLQVLPKIQRNRKRMAVSHHGKSFKSC